jgi:hypothetical protein
VKREPDGKMRVTSGSWEGEKVFFRDQVLEVRNVDGRLHVARKPRQHDEWDPLTPPYDPYGPGDDVIDDSPKRDRNTFPGNTFPGGNTFRLCATN